MVYEVKKTISGHDYYYLYKSYRDKKTGKVKTKYVAYLGKKPFTTKKGL